MSDALVKSKEVSVRLGIHPITLYRWLKDGYGPKPIKVQRQWRWRSEDVEAWLREQQEGDQR